jgi:CBS domain-containing protein
MPNTLQQSLRTDRISQLTLRPVCSVRPETSIEETVRGMRDVRIGCALVVDHPRLLGIFTERDFLLRVVNRRLDLATPVQQVMTADPVVVRQEDSLQEAVERLQQRGYRHLPVLGGSGEPVGVLSVKDIMHYLVEFFPANVYNLPPSPVATHTSREGA